MAGGGHASRRPRRTRAPAPSRRARCAFDEPQFDGDAQQYPFHFLPYASSAFLDGSLAHLPWLQEMPDPMTSAMWSSWVEINPATAAKLGIGDGDVVEVRRRPRHGAHGRRPLAGHRARRRGHAGGAGPSRVHALRERARRQPGESAGADHRRSRARSAWAATRVRVSRVGEPDGRLICSPADARA